METGKLCFQEKNKIGGGWGWGGVGWGGGGWGRGGVGVVVGGVIGVPFTKVCRPSDRTQMELVCLCEVNWSVNAKLVALI